MNSQFSMFSSALNDHHHHNSSSSTTTPANSATKPAFIGGGFALQDHPGGDKSYAAKLGLPPQAKDYSSAAFCAYAAGEYTDF
jgi:hypothetical protein